MEELILRSLQGRTDIHEERKLRSWLRASPQNRAYYDEVAQVWDVAERASPPVHSARPPTARELLERVAATTPPPPAAEPARRDRSWQRWTAPLAAAAAVAVLALGFGLFITSSEESDTFFGVAEFSTGSRERVTVRLGDGTIVRLGASSSLKVDGTGGERNVWLEGDAFFAVVHHPMAPFTVRTEAGTATVLGTRFDMRARGDDLRLVVVDGKVRVAGASADEDAREVGPREMSSVVRGGSVEVTEVDDVYSLLDWLDEALVFQSTPLEQVAIELAYRYGVSVELVNPELAGRTITAWFTDESLEAAVTVICRAADVRCRVSDARVLLGI